MADVLKREVGYFQKHAHRMQYRTFNEKGYQIGSGVIESACKHVVAERCKQAGMRWSKPGINAILFWRCLLKNDTWGYLLGHTRQAERSINPLPKLYTPSAVQSSNYHEG